LGEGAIQGSEPKKHKKKGVDLCSKWGGEICVSTRWKKKVGEGGKGPHSPRNSQNKGKTGGGENKVGAARPGGKGKNREGEEKKKPFSSTFWERRGGGGKKERGTSGCVLHGNGGQIRQKKITGTRTKIKYRREGEIVRKIPKKKKKKLAQEKASGEGGVQIKLRRPPFNKGGSKNGKCTPEETRGVTERKGERGVVNIRRIYKF